MRNERPEQIRLVWRKIDELIPYEHNAKLHPQEQLDKLVGSFDEFGRIVPAGIDADGNLIYGHGRILAARQRGDTEFPCVEISGLTETQRRAFVHADNLLSQSGTDEAILRSEMQALQAAGFDVSITGFDPEGLVLGTEAQLDKIAEDDYEPAPPAEPRTKRGQIWQLGEHRLMCGDATSAEDMQVCVGGQLADLLLTDPPYNVALGVGDSPEIAKIRKRRTDGLKIENDAMSGDDFAIFLEAAFRNANAALKSGGAYYCWHASTSQRSFQTALEAADLPPHQVLIWVKNSIVLGRQDYQWRHEPCFYGWKEGAAHYFTDSRIESTVIPDAQEIDPKKLSKPELVELCQRLLERNIETTVIEEAKPARSELHPTMKPIKLLARLIRNSARKDELVLDPFGGSGSTLIACEQLGRRCRMMEIDPHYCDVIIDRWEAFTGKKAVLLDG